jgi:hypothetical protein
VNELDIYVQDQALFIVLNKDSKVQIERILDTRNTQKFLAAMWRWNLALCPGPIDTCYRSSRIISGNTML